MPDSPLSHRPPRIRIHNELGQRVTLAAGPEQFETLAAHDTPDAVLFLGLGPEPRQAAVLLPGAVRVYYIDAPDFETQMPASWRDQIPDWFQRIAPAELPGVLHPGKLEIRAYRQALRLFPSFWAPVLACCRLAFAPPVPAPRTLKRTSILLAGQKQGLLLKELTTACANAGYDARTLEETPGEEAQLARELRSAAPALFLSVNFAGLDPFGQAAALAEAAGAQVAVWCVDNPWHLLTKLKAPFWKRIPLFVTDSSFCPGLRAAGAARVEHFPLAAWPQKMPQAATADASAETELLFVGRSAFPGRSGFFAGLTPPAQLFDKALRLLEQGQRPDFAWWIRQLGLTALWPGKEVRLAGLCAEECAWRLRLRGLQLAASCGALTVCGDTAWREHLSRTGNVRFANLVDYYGPLMQRYASARYTLNITSLLLPRGLTQRHFDVWAAGGFLLSDATPGLDLFPDALTKPITFQTASGPGDLCHTRERLEKDPALRKDLSTAWRTLIAKEHTYDARLASLLKMLRMKQ